jgi:hypothetical protein
VDGSINNDIYIVSNSEFSEVFGDSDASLLFEWLGELISSSVSITFSVTLFLFYFFSFLSIGYFIIMTLFFNKDLIIKYPIDKKLKK